MRAACHPPRPTRRFDALARLLLAWVAALCLAPAHAERIHRYTVSTDADVGEIRVRACFDGAPPLYLVAESLDAAVALSRAQVEGSRKRLEPNGAELKLGAYPPGTCVVYASNVGQLRAHHQRDEAPARWVGSDVVTEIGVWLWRPVALEADEDIEVRFELPEGMAVSTPWRPVYDAAGQVSGYRVGHTPYDWPGAVAFGHFTPRDIDVPGGRLRVAVLHGSPKLEWEFVRQWLERAGAAVTTLYGAFPTPDVQVLIIPGARGNEPVPSAFVQRGGGPGVQFFVNQRRPLSEFLADWSAVHELSHLLLPRLRPEDAWLSEGLASYYENVLRVRAGMITPEAGWQRMHRGFRRGLQSMPEMTLAAATERMYRDGAFLRVYWQGAAMLLLADQRLREQTGGVQSLDRALAGLHACCLADPVSWDAAALLARLDQITGTGVFSGLSQEDLVARFPDLSETYRKLGIIVDASGEIISLHDDAPESSIRRSITTASPATGSPATPPISLPAGNTDAGPASR